MRFEDVSSGVLDLGISETVEATFSLSSSSSSSIPNDSFPLVTGFRFFFGGNGVETLCFDHQSHPFGNLESLERCPQR